MVRSKFYNFISKISLLFKYRYFSYFDNHSYLSDFEVKSIRNKVNIEEDEINERFEEFFSEIVGDGSSISFASARMAFYVLMKELNIGFGDEVILQAANCSVMVNAILRTGAKPVFVDIDLDTFGTSKASIEKKITKRTKLIVAQHSFGIPCDIENIKSLAKKNKIFLLEDCALSFDSKHNSLKIGNFGDASIFSTDYSKPINTIIGGILYTRNYELYLKIKNVQKLSESLSINHQKNLFKQFLFQRKYFSPSKYGLGLIITYFNNIIIKVFGVPAKLAVLDDDYSIPEQTTNRYPYPAKLPTFLAQLGLFELARWPETKKLRKVYLEQLLFFFQERNLLFTLPKGYLNPLNEIIPLRFAFNYLNSFQLREKLSSNIQVEAIWFLDPLVATKNYYIFGYIPNSCPNVELSCEQIVNLPCNYSIEYNNFLIKFISKIF